MCHTGAIQPLEKLCHILMRESMKQLNDSSGLSQKSFSPHRPPEGIQEGLTYTKETLTESLI